MKRVLVFVVGVIVAIGITLYFCSSNSIRDNYKNGHYFEKIDTGSPEKLFNVLKSAFSRNDYLTIWLCLDYRMQDTYYMALQIGIVKDLFSDKIDISLPAKNKTATAVFKEITSFKGDITRASADSELNPATNIFAHFIEVQVVSQKHDVQIYRMRSNTGIKKVDTKSDSYKILRLSDGFYAKIIKQATGRWKLYSIEKTGNPNYSFPVRNIYLGKWNSQYQYPEKK